MSEKRTITTAETRALVDLVRYAPKSATPESTVATILHKLGIEVEDPIPEPKGDVIVHTSRDRFVVRDSDGQWGGLNWPDLLRFHGPVKIYRAEPEIESVAPETDGLRCDGSGTCPARMHTHGCYTLHRSTERKGGDA